MIPTRWDESKVLNQRNPADTSFPCRIWTCVGIIVDRVAISWLGTQEDLDPLLALHQFEAVEPVAEGKFVGDQFLRMYRS